MPLASRTTRVSLYWIVAVWTASALQPTIPVGAETLSDSTTVENWRLENGLRVSSRHIPAAQATAVTLAFGFGTDHDPKGREGLADLTGELLFTCAAGDVPPRTLEEMNSLRRLGWKFQVARRFTLISEVATLEQFPGVMAQMAARLRGVTVTGEALKEGVKTIQKELGQRYFGEPAPSLSFRVRELASDDDDETTLRRASGKGVAGISLNEIRTRLRTSCVPANAALSVVGNLDGVDVPGLVKTVFAGIPSGEPQAPAANTKLTARARAVPRPGLPAAIGVVGIIAPSLTDTLHPAFFLTTQLLGAQCEQMWRGEASALPSYQYAVLADPELVRFYPPVAAQESNPEALANRFRAAVSTLEHSDVSRESYESLFESALWLLGGPMPPTILDRSRNEPPLLTTLSNGMAGQSLIGGPEFWSAYRRRLEEQRFQGFARWRDHFAAPENQVRLLLTPAP